MLQSAPRLHFSQRFFCGESIVEALDFIDGLASAAVGNTSPAPAANAANPSRIKSFFVFIAMSPFQVEDFLEVL